MLKIWGDFKGIWECPGKILHIGCKIRGVYLVKDRHQWSATVYIKGSYLRNYIRHTDKQYIILKLNFLSIYWCKTHGRTIHIMAIANLEVIFPLLFFDYEDFS